MLTNLDTILYPLIITKVHQVYPGLACISAIAIDTSVINQTRRGMVDNPCEHSWMSYLGNATDKTDKIIEDILFIKKPGATGPGQKHAYQELFRYHWRYPAKYNTRNTQSGASAW